MGQIASVIMETENNAPLKSVYHAFRIYRECGPVGSLTSKEANPDKIQFSPIRESVIFIRPEGQFVDVPGVSEKERLYIGVVQALRETLRDAPFDWVIAFKARFIGVAPIKDMDCVGKDTGDFRTYTVREIAQFFGRDRKTIARWTDRLLDELSDCLKRRGFLPPENQN